MWYRLSKESLKKQDNALLKGKYQFVINTLSIPDYTTEQILKLFNDHAPLQKQWNGKTYILEKAWLEDGLIVAEITIVQNPIPILMILGGIGILVGGLLLWQVLVEVRKMFTLAGEFGRIALYCAMAFGLFLLWKKGKLF